MHGANCSPIFALGHRMLSSSFASNYYKRSDAFEAWVWLNQMPGGRGGAWAGQCMHAKVQPCMEPTAPLHNFALGHRMLSNSFASHCIHRSDAQGAWVWLNQMHWGVGMHEHSSAFM